jgi:hypothetical protein
VTACPKEPNVAAFLLGALTPAEERATMAHAAGCATCQTTLRELATLPDLLALVPRSVVKLIDRSVEEHAGHQRIERREAVPTRY